MSGRQPLRCSDSSKECRVALREAFPDSTLTIVSMLLHELQRRLWCLLWNPAASLTAEGAITKEERKAAAPAEEKQMGVSFISILIGMGSHFWLSEIFKWIVSKCNLSVFYLVTFSFLLTMLLKNKSEMKLCLCWTLVFFPKTIL